MKKKFFNSIKLFVLAITLFTACKKDKEHTTEETVIENNTEDNYDIPTITSDQDLLNISKSPNGFVWFKNSSAFLPKSSGTGHSPTFLRTRFNSIAKNGLDENYQIKEGYQFPEGSLIVKELYNSDSSFVRFAIMLKQTQNPHADQYGWVWGYINSDNSVAHSYTNNGVGCNNCHSESGNIDLVLMKKYFP